MQEIYTSIVDNYVANDEAIKRLEAEQKQLREQILALNQATCQGTHRAVKVLQSERKTVDWKMLAAEQQIPAAVIDSFTKISSVTTLKIS